MATSSWTYYFGGALFSNKDLLGNAVLAETVVQRSKGKYEAVLPQNLEQRDTSPHAIRDEDIKQLLACDLMLAHYDGAELDSGTVVEFMISKFADMPAVIVRSDFRGGGDQAGAGDPWNLMSSFHPRTTNVVVDAMSLYKQGLAALLPTSAANADTLDDDRSGRAGQFMINATADLIIEAFDKVLQLPTTMPGPMQDTVYQWLAMMPGFKLDNGEQLDVFKKLCEAKRAKGLL